MKKALTFTAIALGLAALPAAHAQDGFYTGVSFSQVEYKETGVSTANPMAIGFKLGKQVNKNLAVEARLGTGVSDDNIMVGAIRVNVEIDNHYGVYLKGILPANDAFSVYALAGFTDGKVTARSSGGSLSVSDSDFSYGVGAEYAIGRNLSLNVEWARLFTESTYTLNTLALGVSYRF